MELVFATNNDQKIREIQPVVPPEISVMSLKQAGIDIDIPEPHETLEENAREKARVIHALTGKNCFSEDTGLEVYALNGEPGVKSARYGGEDRSFEKNIDKLLSALENSKNRKARFRTVVCLIWDQNEFLFEGVCEGTILNNRKGTDGFGYDPVFQPDGSDRSFAEMNVDEKNVYSHRRKAVDKLIVFLNEFKLN